MCGKWVVLIFVVTHARGLRFVTHCMESLWLMFAKRSHDVRELRRRRRLIVRHPALPVHRLLLERKRHAEQVSVVPLASEEGEAEGNAGSREELRAVVDGSRVDGVGIERERY